MPSIETLDLERLVAPVSPDAPCGEDLAFSSDMDAIQRARQADDPSLEQGAWVTDLKEADWKFVARQCATLIATRSKDLQLAVWLAEAGAKAGGLRTLGDSLLLIGMLCERWWDGMYPLLEDGGVEQRIGNLAWVAARGAQWVRKIPLAPGADGVALCDVEAARAHGSPAGQAVQARVDAVRQRGPSAFHAALLDDAQHCLAALERLGSCVDERLGADGPGFGALRAALEDAQDFLRPLAQQEQSAGVHGVDGVDGVDGTPAARQAGTAAVQGALSTSAVAIGGVPQTRVQALAQLRAVAEFFRRTEPHSPVAYLAEKAAAWGEQPLHVWLRGVIKDEASFAHVQELLGVAARPD
jgi:type VI secretion system protein ImpA